MTKDFEELFACLRQRKVRALVVGGYAVAFHGQPRFTKDIDVFVEPTPENADRLLAALTDFGFGGRARIDLAARADPIVHPRRCSCAFAS